jgi:hypothetical protein
LALANVLTRQERAAMKQTKQLAAKADNKVKTDYENAPVAFTQPERKEMIADARAYCKAAGVRPTDARIRQVIEDEHGKGVAQAVCGNKATRDAVAKNGTENGRKIAGKPSARKAATTTARKLRTIYGHSVISVARALGKTGMKPAAAVAAIHKHEPKASVLAIKTFVHVGRHGLRGAPAALSKAQLRNLLAA